MGKAICNDFMLAGDALIRAYKIESQVAKYPRIVIDKLVGKYIDLPCLYNIAQDADGELFFHYLNRVSIGRLQDDVKYIMDCVIDAGDQIANYTEKYRWLIRYHNSCCHYGFDSCRITESTVGIREIKLSVRDSVC